MKNIRAFVTTLLVGALVSLWTTGVAVALPIRADDDVADPSLQQVVKDDESFDKTSDVVITGGHVDIGAKMRDGKWTLLARDDSQYPPTWRPLDKMVFYLDETSVQQLPDGNDYSFTGAKPGDNVYAIPQTEVHGVPWLGWSTQAPAIVQHIDGQVKLTFEGHQGKGIFTNFLQEGMGGAPKLLWTSTDKHAQTIHVDPNTHTHTNWVFTRPGIHLVRISISATLKDGTAVTDSQVLRFAIADNGNGNKEGVAGGAADSSKGAGGGGEPATGKKPNDDLIGKARSATWKQEGPDVSALARSEEATQSRSAAIVWWIGGALAVLLIVAMVLGWLVHRRSQRIQHNVLCSLPNSNEQPFKGDINKVEETSQ